MHRSRFDTVCASLFHRLVVFQGINEIQVVEVWNLVDLMREFVELEGQLCAVIAPHVFR